MHPYLILQNWWSQTEAGILTQTTSEADIAALERHYSINLPRDFREYLREGAPTTENWDAEDGNWWPVGRIKNIPDEYPRPVGPAIAPNSVTHLVFLDFSIWSWAWAISCGEDETRGKIAIIGGGGSADGYVANSFSEFVAAYTSNWMSIGQVRAPRLIDRFRAWTSHD
jgi:hypothetical protein